MKKNSLVDVPVLLIFFNRPKQFSQVFEQVKKARPSKLFLYQDGPRDKKDMEGIIECRKIASEIDWNCEVFQNYQSKNFGCDPSEYISQKWMFSMVDRGVVLEDDDVPSCSFFTFCKILLDKYANDERITLISGINYEEITEYCPYDYFFTSDVAIWGWASWKRVVDCWDSSYSFLKMKYEMNLVRRNLKQRNLRKDILKQTQKHANIGKEYYESILIMNQLLNTGLAIVPTKNMIHNIGMISDSTHFNGSLKSLSSNLKKIAFMPTYDIDKEMKHPPFVIEDFSYNDRINKILVRNSIIRKFFTSSIVMFKRFIYGDFKAIKKSISRRLA